MSSFSESTDSTPIILMSAEEVNYYKFNQYSK